jgi:hypothetical protein
MIKTMLGLLVVGAWVDCAHEEVQRIKKRRIKSGFFIVQTSMGKRMGNSTVFYFLNLQKSRKKSEGKFKGGWKRG